MTTADTPAPDRASTSAEPVPSLDRLVELASTTRSMALHSSEGIYLRELRAIVAATTDYAEDSLVRVSDVVLCEDDDGAGEHWISGVKVADIVQAPCRGDVTAQFWPWAAE